MFVCNLYMIYLYYLIINRKFFFSLILNINWKVKVFRVLGVYYLFLDNKCDLYY